MRRFRLLILTLAFVAAAASQSAAQDAPVVSTVIVPVVGSVWGAGGARWMTDVAIVNTTGHEADVALELVAAQDVPAIFFTLAPGQAQRFSDIIGQAFGLELSLSPLRVTSSGPKPVTVNATVYSIGSDGASPGQPIAAYAAQSWYPTVILDGLAFSDDYRTNIGLVNFGDTPATFTLALQRVPGRNIAVSVVPVGASSITHTAIQSIFPMISKGNDFSVIIETASSDTCVYASVIQNGRDAGRFITPRIGTR